MALSAHAYVAPKEYLKLERAAEGGKSEYFDGQIYAMAGASPNHARITANLIFALVGRLRGSSCGVFSSDLRVRTPSTDSYAYPDLSVVCGEPIYEEEELDVLVNPILLVEVLSKSTEGLDRGEKFRRYTEIKSMLEYVLVSQDRPVVEVRVKTDGRWILAHYVGLGATLPLSTLGLEIPLAEIYDTVKF